MCAEGGCRGTRISLHATVYIHKKSIRPTIKIVRERRKLRNKDVKIKGKGEKGRGNNIWQSILVKSCVAHIVKRFVIKLDNNIITN